MSVPFFLHYEGLKILHFLRSSLYYCCLQGDDKGKLKKKEMEKEKEERARKVCTTSPIATSFSLNVVFPTSFVDGSSCLGFFILLF